MSLRGGAAAATTLTLATTAAASLAATGSVDPGVPGSALLAGVVALTLRRRRDGSAVVRRAGLALALTVGAVALGACGGSDGGDGAGGGAPGNIATPTGIYTVVVTATDGTLSHTFDYTLQVN